MIHQDLALADKLVYQPHGLACALVQAEAESAEYGAYHFSLNGKNARFRVAKTTPTKVGQFVTLWKRSMEGPIQPFDITDGIELFIISTRSGNKFGQFVFPASVLHKRGVISGKGREGKRAIRVYPPWDAATNKQAQKTQEWQLKYFLLIPENQPVNNEAVNSLYLSYCASQV